MPQAARPFRAAAVPASAARAVARGRAANQSFRELDGTLVFVDISGFTKLSERLARHGKVGAEELTDAIGSCFAELLAVAYGERRRPAEVRRRRAAAAVHRDRPRGAGARARPSACGARCATIGRLETLGRPGAACGCRSACTAATFHFFLVGELAPGVHGHRPGATQTVDDGGRRPSAGEILVSPATAAALPAELLGQPKGAGLPAAARSGRR